MAKSSKSRVCPDCGKKMSGSDEKELICDGCGKKFDAKDCKVTRDSAKACPKCNDGEMEPEEPEEGKPTNMMKCDSCGHKMKAGTKDSADESVVTTITDSMIWGATPTDLDSAKSMGFIESFKTQADGSIRGRTVGTTIGVYSYRMPDGTIRRRLRHPREVFAEKSVASLALVPVTDGHPPVLVTPENFKQYSVGSVGDVQQDAYRLYPKLSIVDKTAIDNVRAGKKYLSCGYTADIVVKSGNYNGSQYDEEQTNIIYNHLAIVDAPRAGDEAVMHFDGLEVNHTQEYDMNKMIIDGKEYQCDEATVALITSLQVAQKDTMDAKVKAEGERDMLKSQNEKLVADASESAKALPSAVEVAVKSRLALIDSAKKFDVEIVADQSDRQVRVACLAKVAPTLSMDGKEDGYVLAAFDMALASLETRDVGKTQLADGAHPPVVVVDSEDSRQKMIDNMNKQSRGDNA